MSLILDGLIFVEVECRKLPQIVADEGGKLRVIAPLERLN